MKRILAFFMAVSIVISSGAFTVFAADKTAAAEPVTVSVFVSTDRHSYYDKDRHKDVAHGNHLVEVLELVRSDDSITQPTAGIIGGDLVGDGKDSGIDPDDGLSKGQPDFTTADIDREFSQVYGKLFRTYYTYGSHDANCVDDYKTTFLSGPAKEEGYYLYGITYSQMAYATDAQVEAARKAGDLKGMTDLSDKNGMSATPAAKHFLQWVESVDDHMPIIIMTHVPMHKNRLDNLGASIWNQAFSEAAKTHDLLVLWGHNHSQETRQNNPEPPYYLIPKGGSMPVQGPEAEDAETVQLDYTYCNAGYITMGYGSVVSFTDNEADGIFDQMQIKRYNLNLTLYLRNNPENGVIPGHEGGEPVIGDVFGGTGIQSPFVEELTHWAEYPSSVKLTYTGKTQTAYADSDAYTVKANRGKNAGTYKAVFTLKNGYRWEDGSSKPFSVRYKISKAKNPLKVKAKTTTVRLTKLKKKSLKIAAKKAFAVKKARGKVRYKKLKGNKKIAVAGNGKITVKKGLKKGTYKVRVRVTAKGNKNYKSGSKKVTLKVKVK